MRIEAQIVLYLQLREADIDPVQKGQDIAKKHKRDEAKGVFLERHRSLAVDAA